MSPKVFTFIHYAGRSLDDPAMKGTIKIAMRIDLSNPDDVTVIYLGTGDDRYMLDFVAAYLPAEIEQWTAWLARHLMHNEGMTATQRCLVAAGKFRLQGWTDQPLNKPLTKKPD